MFKSYGRQEEGKDDYQVFGINARITDLQAVIGLEQLKKLPYIIEKKRENYQFYREQLREVWTIGMVATNLETCCPWFVEIMVDNRDMLVEFLENKGIKTRAFYPALHKTKVYRSYNKYSFPVAESVAQRGLWLPSSVRLSKDQIKEVCNAIKRFF